MNNKNNIIIISGPSGSGKSTLIEKLLNKNKDLKFSISHTTRNIRGHEQNGIDYHYVNKEDFQSMIENNEFVEWADVYNNYYGTSWEEVTSKSENMDILILDIDINGAKQIKERFKDAMLILISPPSLKALRTRLIKRKNNDEEDIKTRLDIAILELEEYDIYDYIIINDNLEKSFIRLKNILEGYRNKKQFVEKDLLKIIENWKNI